jgi:hypothetical protein
MYQAGLISQMQKMKTGNLEKQIKEVFRTW